MKQVLGFFLRLWAFWLFFFLFGRVMFYVVNLSDADNFSSIALWNAQRYGLRLDCSMAAYFIAIAGLLYSLGHLLRNKVLALSAPVWFTRITAIFFASLMCMNARLYKYWGHHTDISIIEYLKTPKEAFASVVWADWFITALMLVAFLGFLHVWFIPLKKMVTSYSAVRKWFAWSIVLTTSMIIPIRGGVGVAAIGLSSAYHSENNFENHTALNPVWNLMYSITERKGQNKLTFMSEVEANQVRHELYGQDRVGELPFVPNDSLNVVFLVLESFTANVVESIGGMSGLTPNLDSLARQGISFTNFYSSGDRSDRGLTTLFTGYPSLTHGRLLKYPNKLSKAPNLYRNLNDDGYYTSFYYGGNLEFANLKLLFSEGRVDKVVSEGNLPEDLPTGKWGVRDEAMFDLFLEDVTNQPQPFFSTLYTLSSHEPFDIPGVSLDLKRPDKKFFEAIYYTDSCVGSFIRKLKRSDVWSNTLVVITADHGVKKPDNVMLYSPRKYRVPMILTGGIANQARSYSHYCSHTDLPYTLHRLLIGSGASEFKYSKSVFDTSRSFAPYYYNFGAGIINGAGCVVYDIKGKYFLVNTVEQDSISERMKHQILGVTQAASHQFSAF
ncbi:MAG: LTA synthase family protein [Bacteroidia bacterium]|nr:LTA synthase family protein [Bacteroidia bacterium]